MHAKSSLQTITDAQADMVPIASCNSLTAAVSHCRPSPLSADSFSTGEIVCLELAKYLRQQFLSYKASELAYAGASNRVRLRNSHPGAELSPRASGRHSPVVCVRLFGGLPQNGRLATDLLRLCDNAESVVRALVA